MGNIKTGQDPAQGSRLARLWSALDLVLRIALGVLFLYSGIAKALDPRGAAQAVDGYAIVPSSLVFSAALLLIAVEVILGLLLLIGLFTRFAAGGVALLTLIFLAALIQAKARDLDITCGCFGASNKGTAVSWFDILRDLPILAAAIYLAARRPRAWGLDLFLAERDRSRDSD